MRMPKTAGATGRAARGASAADAGAAGADPRTGTGTGTSTGTGTDKQPAAPGGRLGGWRAAAAPALRRDWQAALRRDWQAALRRHWLAAALLLAGLVLRAATQIAYRPALLYYDSVKYLYNAWPGTDPVGYKVPLRFILFFGDLSTVAAIQHLLGLAMAAVLYLVLLRRGCPRWLASLAIAPVLLDAYQLQMEQTIMPDVWFEALIVAGIAILLWRPRPGLRAVLAAGLILGASATLRQVGEILVLPAAVYVAIVAGGWRGRTGHAVALCAAFAVPILVYSGISFAQNGHFQLSHSGTSELYGRMAAAANCATLRLPAYQRPLCPTPRQRALGPDGLEHRSASPLRGFAPPAGLQRTTVISDFNRAVLLQQPLRVIAGLGRDAVKLFALSRVTSPGDTSITRWQFQDGYPTYRPNIGLSRQHVLEIGVQLTANGGISVRPLDASLGGKAAVTAPVAAFLRAYQLDGGYTPGPLLAIFVIAGLAGSASLARPRRRRDSAAAGHRGMSPGRQEAGPGRQAALGCFLFFAAAVAVLGTSDLFEFSWRYQLPALVILPPAGALGAAVIIGGIRRRSGRSRERGEHGQVPELAAPAR